MQNLSHTSLGIKWFLLPAEGQSPEQIRAPMTKVIGRFQNLKYITHPHLCAYIDIVRGKHDRIYIVSEHFRTSFANFIPDPTGKSTRHILAEADLQRITYQVMLGLHHLNSHEITHRELCPENILLDHEKNAKIANYGFYHITNRGSYVKFPIGHPNYMSPEVVARGPQNIPTKHDRKSDMWSVGAILLEMVDGKKMFGELGIYHTFLSILNMLGHDFPPRIHAKISDSPGYKDESKIDVADLSTLSEYDLGRLQKSRLDAIVKIYAPSISKYSEQFEDIIRLCLTADARTRPDADELLGHPYFLALRRKDPILKTSRWVLKPHFKSAGLSLRMPNFDQVEESVNSNQKVSSTSTALEKKPFNPTLDDIFAERPLSEIFHFWKLAGGNVEQELQKLGVVNSYPPIHKVPFVVRASGEIKEPQSSEATQGYDPRIISLSLDSLKKRLAEHKRYWPSTHESPLSGHTGFSHWTTLKSEQDPIMKIIEVRRQHQEFLPPLEYREQDIDYQRQRATIFRDIISRHGAIRGEELLSNSIVDIPPSLRGELWAILLNVGPDLQQEYVAIDKEKPGSCDHQINVDIPRCHQYHELLSSPEGHDKFRRILKAWIVHNPTSSYWQGLDSLCAPFLSLNFNNESRAFACLHQLTSKFLKNFFLPDNSAALQETLMLFDHALMYHDPELGTHLKKQGFIPEMFAIPWFLTLFSHVFPLDTTYILWDTLLLTNATFVCSLAVAIIKSLRHYLLPSDLNSCIVIFSNLPTINIEQCIATALDIHAATPDSLVEPVFSKHPPASPEEIASLPPLYKLKEEIVGRIRARDLKRFHKHMLVIDLRIEEDYAVDSIPRSVNLPPPFVEERLYQIIARNTTAHIVIADDIEHNSMAIAELLIKRLVPRVCILTRGISAVRKEAPSLLQATRDWTLTATSS